MINFLKDKINVARIREFILVNRIAAMALLCMVFQNSAHTLLIRYSRGVLHERYIASTNVILVELTKFAISGYMMVRSAAPGANVVEHFKQTLLHSKAAFIPAFLYFIQNTLAYVGLQNLEAGAFAVLVQLKTLTTAVFSVILLNKRLSANQWRALCLLVLAAILIETPPCKESANGENANNNNNNESKNNFLGVCAVLGMITTSGSAGVYFEKVLKTTSGTIWERNLQLSAHSIIFGLLFTFIYDGKRVLAEGFFTGYSVVPFLIAFIGAAGGILVAVVMKYADNIIKSFGTAVSICVTSVLSIPLLGASLGAVFWVGAFMVVLSIFNYSDAHPGSSSTTTTAAATNSNNNSNGAAAKNQQQIHSESPAPNDAQSLDKENPFEKNGGVIIPVQEDK